jgi:hypothetical protein
MAKIMRVVGSFLFDVIQFKLAATGATVSLVVFVASLVYRHLRKANYSSSQEHI